VIQRGNFPLVYLRGGAKYSSNRYVKSTKKNIRGQNKTVYVGVSGGVDSSVSAALLQKEGYNVVGVFIRTWTPDFIACTWKEERLDAMRVCAHLCIPYLECDAEEAYKKGVADYMIEEYKKGRTPNPDVMCNREVKFGVFWNFAKAHGADLIATGHYARTDGSRLLKSIDPAKDQSYFLWTLTEDDLSHTLFPVGHLQKAEVRKLAEKFKLPTATKKDSQGICFLGLLDMKEFLSHYIQKKQGDVYDEDGKTIGYHDGAAFLTLGERHGFTITKKTPGDKPYYVVGKNIKKNTITVSNDYLTKKSEKGVARVELLETSWVMLPDNNKKYTAEIRYHGEQLPCRILNALDTAAVEFNAPVLVSPGQSIVLYDEDVCLGGGIVV
jgi:tRNA-specific 2-thiouridylase